jgi:hypothetical protein
MPERLADLPNFAERFFLDGGIPSGFMRRLPTFDLRQSAVVSEPLSRQCNDAVTTEARGVMRFRYGFMRVRIR